MTRRTLLAQSALFALRQGNFDEAVKLIDDQTTSGQVSAAVLFTRHGSTTQQHAFGKAANTGAVFLLASITKPMTAAALMVLVDRRQLSLSDPVERFIPEFRGEGRERVLVRHLLTHTSGLPDMLPEDQDLRKRHAPLSEFVAGTCRTPLLFAPGTEVRYQSMGILLASEIVARITKQPFPAFVREHVFQPLGMSATSLGLGGRAISQTMECQVKEPSDWDWNSSYWRNLASPWGGAHSNVNDLAQFLQYFAQPDQRVLKPETATSMIANHTVGLNKPWGVGWMLNNGQFGKGCSNATFGHSGSTGTMCWLDPRNELAFVLLTTKPAAQSTNTLLSPVSDLISTGS
jgi:CubicO group peptidase (beta-lactamase class C family)